MHRRRSKSAASLGALAVALVLVAGTGTAAAAPVVIAPEQGERVTEHPVEVVVRAGPDARDLTANLNGKPVGAHFTREPNGTRALDASNSHGLDHGENVLRVRARTEGGRVQRQTVRFTVSHRRPLVGAGRDMRVAAGATFEITGDVDRHPRGPRAKRVSWRIVKAPRTSALAPKSGDARRQAEDALVGEETLTPSFRPDVNGSYVLKAAAATGGSSVTDRLTVAAGPANQLVEIDTATELTGTSPYGIRVGGQTYAAPPMHSAGGQDSFVGSSSLWGHYAALWQVVALDRKTLGFVWNKTYGWCDGTRGTGFCERGDNGEPFLVLGDGGAAEGSAAALRQEFASLGQERLVIATNHYDNDTAWGLPDTGGFATGALSAVGFPAKAPPGLDNDASSATVVGVPGMAAGDADYSVVPRGARMNGYLAPDAQGHWGYIPAAREEFDTRAAPACAAGKCSVTHVVGSDQRQGTIDDGFGGYLVTAYDGHSLAVEESRVFVTAGATGDFNGNANLMAAFLRQRNDAGNVVVISSIETPGQSTAVTYSNSIAQATWRNLADQVAALGGTHNRFNRAAATKDTDYTLVGWSGAQEGDAPEGIGGGVHLWGALVPNGESLFRPVNTSSVAPPAERLNRILVQPPSDAWPLGGAADAGARAALADIGEQAQLSSNPRAAYATIPDAEAAILAREAVEDALPSGDGYAEADFDRAQRQLKIELRQVGRVRDYLADLAAPVAHTNAETWEDVRDVSDRLRADLKVAKEEDTVGLDPFSLIEALLDFGGAFAGDPELGSQISAFAAAFETASVFYNGDYDGSSAIDADPNVHADELADSLKDQSQNTIDSFKRMGDVIVSDPAKLAEVGTHGGCASCSAGYEEYSTSHMDVARAMAERGLYRSIYEAMVPYSYEIADTGLTARPNPEFFSCTEGGTPFGLEQDQSTNTTVIEAPARAYTELLDDFDPTGNASASRFYIMVHHEGFADWSWPDPTILSRMFDPVNLDEHEERGGLGIDPGDLMREKWLAGGPTRYEYGHDCYWN